MLLSHFPTLRSLFGPQRATLDQRRSVLRLIAASAEERLPLAPLIESWVRDERGGQVRRLRRLAGALRDGAPIADALERVPGVVNDDESLLVRFASQSGTLASSLRRRLDAEDPEALPATEANLRKAKQYLMVVLFVALPIALWFCIAVMPVLRQIFEEFEISLPPATEFAIAVASVGANFWLLAVLAMVAIIWSRFFSWPGAQLRRTLAPRLFGAVRNRQIASVLDRLGETATAGRPLPGAISTLARYHFDPVLRHKLLVVRNDLELGSDLWSALLSQGLLTRREAAAVGAAERLGVHGWSLSTLGAARLGRTNRWVTLAASLFVPLVVLGLGALVLCQALGAFAALERLISSLC